MDPWEPRPQMGTYFLPLTSQICLLSTPSTKLGICQSSLWRHPVPFPPRFPSTFRDSGTEGHPHMPQWKTFPPSPAVYPPIPPHSNRKEEMHLLLLVIYLFGETEMMGKYLKISIFTRLSGTPCGGMSALLKAGSSLFCPVCLSLSRKDGT